jgi:hypothetical protein
MHGGLQERVSTSINPNSVWPNVPVNLTPPFDGRPLAGNRVDANLPIKKQLVSVAKVEVECASIFQEELTLFGDKDFKRCEVKRFEVNFSVREIRIAGYRTGNRLFEEAEVQRKAPDTALLLPGITEPQRPAPLSSP